MKKKMYLALATLLCVASVGSNTLTASAAPLNGANIIQRGNKVLITNMGNCNVNSLLETILQQLPGCKPSKPESPDNTLPENNCPGTNCPDTDCSDNNCPNDNTPDTNVPETNLPDNNKPDSNLPGENKPETENPDTQVPEQDSTHPYVKKIVDLVNQERRNAGLSPLTLDKKVTAAAQVRAKEIRHSFSHTRPNGSNFSTALREQNVSYRRSGENIAWGQPTPEAVVKAWMNSAGHRANILNSNFTKIGVGYVQYNGRNYWSQLFIG